MANNKPTGWVGWVFFASALMLLVGSLQAIAGLVALFKDDFFVVTKDGLLAFDYTAWGWVHLIIGVVIFAAGCAILAGQTWGRIIGVFLAILSAIANLAFVSAYPIWSITALVIDGMIIYALTMHGTEVKE
ncbi:MAG TPA: hypothetical protein VFK11_04665 [Candidatus Saccharimonadales bacterium]|nr:hypothetical protein [Candidatus Saccharimonadales bacterium]